MTTIIGIFDNARDLDKAVGRLARAGFEDTVYDEAIVAGEALNVGPPVFASGSAPAVVWGSAEPALPPKPGHQAIARAFKTPSCPLSLAGRDDRGLRHDVFSQWRVRPGQNRQRARRASHGDPAGVRRYAGESS